MFFKTVLLKEFMIQEELKMPLKEQNSVSKVLPFGQ